MFPNMKHRLEGTMNDIKITQKLTYPLKDLKVPTLVIHGTHDPVVPYEEHGLRHKAEIPNVDFYTVDRGEHVAIFTHRAKIQKKVSSFLKS
jgi:pimeloyl-ACP methyl ester carboxylesterase